MYWYSSDRRPYNYKQLMLSSISLALGILLPDIFIHVLDRYNSSAFPCRSSRV